MTAPLLDPDAKIEQPRLWHDNGWTARVIKNDDDDGWAVAMTKDGAAEPALIGPWTMGRDKKNPKPLDGNAFSTLVKTASELCGVDRLGRGDGVCVVFTRLCGGHAAVSP